MKELKVSTIGEHVLRVEREKADGETESIEGKANLFRMSVEVTEKGLIKVHGLTYRSEPHPEDDEAELEQFRETYYWPDFKRSKLLKFRETIGYFTVYDDTWC